MGMNRPPRNKQRRPGEPSLWAYEPADDALSLLEEKFEGMSRHFGMTNTPTTFTPCLRRMPGLRGLVAQLSNLIRRNVVHAAAERPLDVPAQRMQSESTHEFPLFLPFSCPNETPQCSDRPFAWELRGV
jgi:hypothetical protein